MSWNGIKTYMRNPFDFMIVQKMHTSALEFEVINLKQILST